MVIVCRFRRTEILRPEQRHTGALVTAAVVEAGVGVVAGVELAHGASWVMVSV
jgi:hypothetical protein